MTHAEAISKHGVFEPLGQVRLSENQRVRLSLEAIGAAAVDTGLRQNAELQAPILRRHGPLPDSCSDIAENRRR